MDGGQEHRIGQAVVGDPVAAVAVRNLLDEAMSAQPPQVTLAVRCAPLRTRQVLVSALSSGGVRRLSWAPGGAALSVGVTWPLYLTGLYHQTLDHPLLHDLVHVHMLCSGCLFTFAMISPNPIRGRGSRGIRLLTLFFAVAVHDILSKYLYVHAAGLAAADPATGSALSWQLGAQ